MKNISLFVAAIATSLILGNSLFGADQIKGGEALLKLNKIETREQVESLKPGDAVAMACVKCKSITVHNVNTEKGHIKTMTLGEKHLCPGCNSTIEVVGVGKGAKTKVKHVCKACGDNSVFCCATTGGKPTEGMDKK